MSTAQPPSFQLLDSNGTSEPPYREITVGVIQPEPKNEIRVILCIYPKMLSKAKFLAETTRMLTTRVE
jgi:hypothetical protein